MADTPDPRPATRGWVRVLLFVSLALNLMIVGAVGGLAWTFRDGRERPLRDAAAPYVFALERSERRALRRAARDHLPVPAQRGESRRADYDAVLRTLRDDRFDRAAAETVLTRQSARARERRIAGQKALLDHWQAMGAAERAAYADRLERILNRGARRPRDDRR